MSAILKFLIEPVVEGSDQLVFGGACQSAQVIFAGFAQFWGSMTAKGSSPLLGTFFNPVMGWKRSKEAKAGIENPDWGLDAVQRERIVSSIMTKRRSEIFAPQNSLKKSSQRCHIYKIT